MASDSFTAADGTPLDTHSAGGVTWGGGAGQPGCAGKVIGNVACADASDYFSVSARATSSSVDYSQVVFKAGAYPVESKAVAVRASDSTQGYWLQVTGVSGDNITGFSLFKASGTTLTGVDLSGSPVSRLVDHTVAIKATTVGGDVQIQAWLDGSPLTFEDTDNDTETPSTTFTDLSTATPITAAGNPGFMCFFFDGIDASNSAFDDWTDVESGGGGGVEITGIDDVTITHGQTGVTITGTGFGASQGGGRVVVSPTDDIDDVGAVNQTVTSWSDTSIDFTAVLSSFAFGTLYVFVENDDEESNADGEPVSRIVASATLDFTGANAFFDENGDPVEATGTLYVWRSPRPPTSVGTPDQIITSFATDSAGERSQSITLGSLDDGDTVFGMLFAADGTDLYWAGEVLPDYA